MTITLGFWETVNLALSLANGLFAIGFQVVVQFERLTMSGMGLLSAVSPLSAVATLCPPACPLPRLLAGANIPVSGSLIRR